MASEIVRTTGADRDYIIQQTMVMYTKRAFIFPIHFTYECVAVGRFKVISSDVVDTVVDVEAVGWVRVEAIEPSVRESGDQPPELG